jgi:hypothetical protein
MNDIEGNRITVSTDGTAGPYVCIEAAKAVDVARHLRSRGIACSCAPNPTDTAIAVINLGSGADVAGAQEALDSME